MILEKYCGKLNKMKIYTENLKNEILKFDNNNNEIFVIKNFKLFTNYKNCLLIKSKYVLIKFKTNKVNIDTLKI